MKNKILSWILRILAISFGAFLVVFGGYDDSPGAQGLGLVLIIITIIFIIKSRKKNNNLL